MIGIGSERGALTRHADFRVACGAEPEDCKVIGRRTVALSWAGVSALALCAAGCASGKAPEGAPEWYAQTVESHSGAYPRLSDIPQEHQANTDPAYWDAVAAEMAAAMAELRADPRNEPLSEEDVARFEAEARATIDASRDAH